MSESASSPSAQVRKASTTKPARVRARDTSSAIRASSSINRSRKCIFPLQVAIGVRHAIFITELSQRAPKQLLAVALAKQQTTSPTENYLKRRVTGCCLLGQGSESKALIKVGLACSRETHALEGSQDDLTSKGMEEADGRYARCRRGHSCDLRNLPGAGGRRRSPAHGSARNFSAAAKWHGNNWDPADYGAGRART